MVIVLFLVLLGLCLGSFVNAFVWRLHEQDALKKNVTKNAKRLQELSITRGRSMCPHCGYALASKDLVPVLSWLYLRGKCRYCSKRIPDSPFTELIGAFVLPFSYIVWPYATQGWSVGEVIVFGLWAVIFTGLLALMVYDIRWYLLPDKIVFPLTVLGAVMIALLSFVYSDPLIARNACIGALVIAGIFYLLFQFSKGAWIGGGDVKLGVLLGLLGGGFMESLLLLFLASILGTVYGGGLAVTRKQKLDRKLRIPFGPFLITAAIVTLLFGSEIVQWYSDLILSV